MRRHVIGRRHALAQGGRGGALEASTPGCRRTRLALIAVDENDLILLPQAERSRATVDPEARIAASRSQRSR